MPEVVIMEAQVVAYHREAGHLQFDTGSRSEDATELKLTSPPEKNGSAFWLYHSRPPAADSLWREAGAHIRFSMDAADLARYSKLYSGSAWDLQRID